MLNLITNQTFVKFIDNNIIFRTRPSAAVDRSTRTSVEYYNDIMIYICGEIGHVIQIKKKHFYKITTTNIIKIRIFVMVELYKIKYKLKC